MPLAPQHFDIGNDTEKGRTFLIYIAVRGIALHEVKEFGLARPRIFQLREKLRPGPV